MYGRPPRFTVRIHPRLRKRQSVVELMCLISPNLWRGIGPGREELMFIGVQLIARIATKNGNPPHLGENLNYQGLETPRITFAHSLAFFLSRSTCRFSSALYRFLDLPLGGRPILRASVV
jgi:hypothetical protein